LARLVAAAAAADEKLKTAGEGRQKSAVEEKQALAAHVAALESHAAAAEAAAAAAQAREAAAQALIADEVLSEDGRYAAVLKYGGSEAAADAVVAAVDASLAASEAAVALADAGHVPRHVAPARRLGDRFLHGLTFFMARDDSTYFERRLLVKSVQEYGGGVVLYDDVWGDAERVTHFVVDETRKLSGIRWSRNIWQALAANVVIEDNPAVGDTTADGVGEKWRTLEDPGKQTCEGMVERGAAHHPTTLALQKAATRARKPVVTWGWVQTCLRERQVLPLPLPLPFGAPWTSPSPPNSDVSRSRRPRAPPPPPGPQGRCGWSPKSGTQRWRWRWESRV
jgi:hypothetical protein